MPGSHLVLRGDARRIPIADGSVSLIVTSPPYWAQRSYRDAGGHYDGQIGSELHPRHWLEAMWEVMKECWRVLDDQGSVFVNLGDKRAGSGGHNNNGLGNSTLGHHKGCGGPHADRMKATRRNAPDRYEQAHFGRRKSRQLLPERFAIGCEDGLADPEGIGWIVRQVMIWCLSGGTRVYARTPTGDRPIMLRDLYRAYKPENIQLWNGQRWTQVQGWSQTPAPGDALEIELRSGQRIGCTRNHQWPTARGLLRADELTIGDVIESTKLDEPSPALRSNRWIDRRSVGWFVGLYLAEGSRSDTTIQLAGHAKEMARGDRLKLLAREFDGTYHRYQTSANGVTDNLHGSILAGILDNFVSGRNAHDKRLTIRAWQQSDAFLRDILDGYLEGDGHHDAKNDRWRLGFCENDELAADLRTLCARLGISLRLRRSQSENAGRWFPTWRGELRFARSAHHNSRSDFEVVAIRASRARYFYDVGVADEPHTFALACGVLTHNSKANGLPESVTDRTRDDFEVIYHLTKSERYFAAIDEIREPSQIVFDAPQDGTEYHQRALAAGEGHHRYDMRTNNPLGKVPGSVWRIASEPLRIPDWAKERYNLPDHFACLDADTEILTRRGWLRHTALEVGDQVAGYNLDTGLAEWTGCHAVHRYDYDGPMVSVEKRDLSMRLTPNHRCLASRMTGPIHARGPLEVVMAEDLTPRHFIPRSVEFAPEPATKAIGENMAALCGWVAAEGWYASDLVYLSQSQTANPEKVAAIDALLERFEWRLSDRGYRRSFRSSLGFIERHEGTRVYRGRPWTDVTWRLPLWLGHEVQRLMPAKFLTCELANLPAEEARALLDAFVDGDGHRRPDERLGIFQKERGNLDWLQMIAVRLGYKTTLRRGSDKWVLYLTPGGRSVTLRGTNGVNKPVPREHYRGVVWCPTTGTGTFVARRNGSVFVTGNSFPTEIPRRLILGFSPNGICTACNEPRRPVVEKHWWPTQSTNGPPKLQRNLDNGWDNAVTPRGKDEATITGYACRCTPHMDHPERRGKDTNNPKRAAGGPAGYDWEAWKTRSEKLPVREYHLAGWSPPPTRPSVVLDVFGGTGTTALVAETLGRTGVTLDLSSDYCHLARWRIEESGHGRKTEQRTWGERQGTLL
jgi:DNA methylase